MLRPLLVLSLLAATRLAAAATPAQASPTPVTVDGGAGASPSDAAPAVAVEAGVPAAPTTGPAPPTSTSTSTSTSGPSPPADGQRPVVEILYDAAVEALVLGDLEGAAAALDRAAAVAGSEERGAAARTLAGRVRVYASRAAPRPTAAPPAVVLQEESPSSRPAARRRVEPEAQRSTYLVATTMLGVGVWGWTMPLAVGVTPSEHPRAFLGLYMLGGGAAFTLPYLATERRPPTWGETNLAFYGATRGMEYGVLVSNIAFGSDGGNLAGPDGKAERALATSVLLGSVGGLMSGQAWARASAMTAGQARTLAAVADYGLLCGFGVGHLLKLDQTDRPPEAVDHDSAARGMATAGLVGVVAGLSGGRFVSRGLAQTWGDGEMMRGAGVLGAWTGATAIALVGAEDSSRALVAGLMVGGGLGLVSGGYLVRDQDFSVGSSVVTELSMLAGGFVGGGLSYLLIDGAGPRTYMSASALGGLLGYGAAYRAYSGEATDRRARASAPPRLALFPRVGADGTRGLDVAGRF